MTQHNPQGNSPSGGWRLQAPGWEGRGPQECPGSQSAGFEEPERVWEEPWLVTQPRSEMTQQSQAQSKLGHSVGLAPLPHCPSPPQQPHYPPSHTDSSWG